MDLGKLVVSIEGDNSGLDKALKSSTASVDQAIGQIVGAIGLGSVAFKGLELAANGIKFNAMMESAEVGFGIMLGSVDDAKAKLSELKYLADHSPLTFSGVTSATTTLLQFGIAGDKVIPTVKMLGDVAGGNEERMKQLALAFAQVSAAGKLQGQDLLQMINAGYNPLMTISEKTGESMGQLRDRMSAGAITADEVAEAFKTVTSEGGKFYGMLEAKSKTLEGSFTTLGDATDTFLGKATQAFTGPVLVGVQTLTGLLNLIPGELGTIVLTIGTVTAGVGALALGVGALAPAFAALGVTINIALLPLLGVTATVAAIGAAIALVGKAWADAQPKEERIKQLTDQFIKQGKTFREAQILARQLVEDQEKSAELTKTMGENYRGYYSAQAKAAEAQKAADEAKIKSQNEINQQLKTWDDLNKAGIVTEEQWLNEKIKIRQKIIDSLQEEAIKTGKLSDQAKEDIKAQQAGIDGYNAALKVMKLRQSEVKVEVGKTTQGYWELQDAQKLATVKAVELTKETAKIPPYLAEATGREYEIIDGMIVAKEKTADVVDMAVVLALKYEEGAVALKPMLDYLGYAGDLFNSLGRAATKFGNDDLGVVLAGLAKMSDSLSNAANSAMRIFASGGTDIGAWVQLATSAIDLVGDAWDSLFGNNSKKHKEQRDEERQAEQERLAAVAALSEEYTKKTNSELQNLELERDKAIAEAKRIGADVFQIEEYYAKEIAKLRDKLSGATAEETKVAALKKSLEEEYALRKASSQAAIRANESALRSTVSSLEKEIDKKEAYIKKYGFGVFGDFKEIDKLKEKLAAAQASLSTAVQANDQAVAASFASLDNQLRTELENLEYNLITYQGRLEEATSGITSAITNALYEGTSEADFTQSIMDMLRKMAIDAAILAGGFADKFKAIGVMIADALKDGLQEGEVTSIKSQISSLYGDATSSISSINSLFNVPGFADGTNYAPGGLARVNERGGEIINLPRGSQVIPADQTQKLMERGGNVYNINVQSTAPLDPIQTAWEVKNTMQQLAFQGVPA